MKKILLICLMLVVGTAVFFTACNPAHQHTFDLDHWSSDAEGHYHKATCGHDVNDGKIAHTFRNGVCTVCKYKEGHVHDEALTPVPEKSPTCTEPGTKAHFKCLGCGALFETAYSINPLTEEEVANLTLPATGHKKPLIVHPEKKADCLGGNITYYECEVCNTLFRDSDAKEEITEAQTKTDPDGSTHKLHFVQGTEGTCSVSGTIDHWECEVCGADFDKETEGNLIDINRGVVPYNHTPQPVAGTASGCTSYGQHNHYYCNDCRKYFSDPQGLYEIENVSDMQIPMLGHSYVNQVPVSDGAQGHHTVCRRCGESDDIKAHTMENGYCIECGYCESGSIPEKGKFLLSDVIYEFDRSTHKATVKATAEECTRVNFVIADKVSFGGETFEVNAIGDGAFKSTGMYGGGVRVESVIIPKTVTSIGNEAFRGQTDMEGLVISNSITSVGTSAFTAAALTVYYDDTSLDSMSETLKNIIDSRWIVKCYKESRPTFDFEKYWHYSDDLKETPVGYTEELEWLGLSDRILYSYSEATRTAAIIGYKGYKSNIVLAIPETVSINGVTYTVTAIRDKAFWFDKDFASGTMIFNAVILPDSIRSIGNMAFAGQDVLQYVVLGDQISEVGKNAFECPSADLFFRGTYDEYIEFASGLRNNENAAGLLSHHTFYYAEEDPGMNTEGLQYWHFTDKRELEANIWHLTTVSRSGITYKLNEVTREAIAIRGAVIDKIKIPEQVYADNDPVPYTVVAIDENAFSWDSTSQIGYIKYVEIPKTVKEIRSRAFYRAASVTEVVIHKDVTIATDAFANAFANSYMEKTPITIYFNGGEEDWEEFKIKNNGFMLEISNVTYILLLRDGEYSGNTYGTWDFDDDGNVKVIKSKAA